MITESETVATIGKLSVEWSVGGCVDFDDDGTVRDTRGGYIVLHRKYGSTLVVDLANIPLLQSALAAAADRAARLLRTLPDARTVLEGEMCEHAKHCVGAGAGCRLCLNFAKIGGER